MSEKGIAVVVGSGIAGLAAANVLAKFYSKVIVLERDPNLGSDLPRPGAIQGAHLHVLLKQGQNILFKRFPKLYHRLLEEGVRKIDWAKDTLWENANGRFPRYNSGIETLSVERPLLERLLYEEVRALSQIEFRAGKFVDVNKSELVVKNSENIRFDLLILASGQGNIAKKYFARKNSISLGLRYDSCIFNADEVNLPEVKQYYYQTAPNGGELGGVICPISNGRVIATIIEYDAKIHQRCDTHVLFLARARHITGGQFYSIIKNARPVSPVRTYSKKEMYRYSEAATHNRNVIIIGDAVTSLNPAFGQGMTLALAQSELLEQELKRGQFCAYRYHTKQHRLSEIPFKLAQMGSVRSGPKKFLLESYLKACRHSRFLHNGFLRQLHLLNLKEAE